jgi:hypothetical protein
MDRTKTGDVCIPQDTASCLAVKKVFMHFLDIYIPMRQRKNFESKFVEQFVQNLTMSLPSIGHKMAQPMLEDLVVFTMEAGLPDGIFSSQKSRFGYILEGLAMEDVGIL